MMEHLLSGLRFLVCYKATNANEIPTEEIEQCARNTTHFIVCKEYKNNHMKHLSRQLFFLHQLFLIASS